MYVTKCNKHYKTLAMFKDCLYNDCISQDVKGLLLMEHKNMTVTQNSSEFVRKLKVKLNELFKSGEAQLVYSTDAPNIFTVNLFSPTSDQLGQLKSWLKEQRAINIKNNLKYTLTIYKADKPNTTKKLLVLDSRSHYINTL